MAFKITLGMLIFYILGITASAGISFFISPTFAASLNEYSSFVVTVFLFILIPFFLYAIANFNKRKIFRMIFLIFFIAGFLLTLHKSTYVSPLKEYAGTIVEIEGMVSKYTVYANRTVYWLENPVIYNGDYELCGGKREKVQLSIYNPTFNYSYGTIIKARGVLREPSSKRNPGGFDYQEYLARRNIFVIVNVQESQVTKVGEKIGNPVLKAGLGMKERLTKLSYTLKDHEGGIFRAIILGEKSGLTPENRHVYQGLGVMHIFAVSGLHVGFVMFLLLGVTSVFRKPSSSSTTAQPPSANRKDSIAGIGSLFSSFWHTNNAVNIFIILCLLIYCAATGFSSPVMRASIMLGIYLWGRNNWNNLQTANSFFLAALVLLLLNPLLVFDAGFQFTFAATGFIIFLTPILKTNKYLGNELISVSLAAWLGTLPLTAYYFNILSPLGIIMALPAGLMAGGVVILGFIAFILDFISVQLSQFLITSVGGIIFYANHLLQLFSKLPLLGEGIVIATPKLPTVFLYYLTFILAFAAYNHRYNPHLRFFILKNCKPVIALILVCLFLLLSFQVFAPSYLEVVFLDVGQGDCIFIKTPKGRVVLIDGGGVTGTHNYGDLVVIPFLKHLGIKKVDVVINTHPHTDHLAGLYPVLRQYPVNLTLIPKGFDDDYEYLMEIIEERGLNYAYAREGQTIALEPNIQLNILHPTSNYPVSLGANNNSIVAELIYDHISFLLTGDIEMEAINHMLPYTTNSNVLKFPHHGSSYSFNIDYLRKVNPEIVVIQVGANNSFGHPGKNVLEYFANEGVPVYRNDLHGAITIYSKGQSINRVDTVIKQEVNSRNYK